MKRASVWFMGLRVHENMLISADFTRFWVWEQAQIIANITRTTSFKDALSWLCYEWVIRCSSRPTFERFLTLFLLLKKILTHPVALMSPLNEVCGKSVHFSTCLLPFWNLLICVWKTGVGHMGCDVWQAVDFGSWFKFGPVAGKLRPPVWWPQSEERLSLAAMWER